MEPKTYKNLDEVFRCGKKRKFISARKANLYYKGMLRGSGRGGPISTKLVPYLCDYCNYYHLGSLKRK